MSGSRPRATLDDPTPERVAAVIRPLAAAAPAVAVVLGSGLGAGLGDDLDVDGEVGFHELPGFPGSTVPGHAGRVLCGTLAKAPVVVFSGRIHFYEGHGIAATTLIPRVAAALGVRTMVLTNAAGGLDPSMRPGQLMLISDHLNWMGVNPLTGWRMEDGSPAFVDLSQVYDRRLLEAARDAAEAAGVPVTAGVYAAAAGPSYETPAEVAALAGLGARAVGMSTVPEAVASAALGLRVFGVSLITNLAGREATHQQVLAAAAGATVGVRAILDAVVPLATAPDDGIEGHTQGKTDTHTTGEDAWTAT